MVEPVTITIVLTVLSVVKSGFETLQEWFRRKPTRTTTTTTTTTAPLQLNIVRSDVITEDMRAHSKEKDETTTRVTTTSLLSSDMTLILIICMGILLAILVYYYFRKRAKLNDKFDRDWDSPSSPVSR
ncbi:unnamed protein product [Adineta ricciae]|uniref:Uncharacterized protein n=1 Tax=Adineta ricciae TaxID=249248 RepID=A0A815G9F6_ADIRI|nr:unnamed protein product [Adineta ricciae]CAF1335752.1 unnamed protein product [Adineta ricciae]